MNDTENKSTFWSQFFVWATVIYICTFATPWVIRNFIRTRATSSVNPCINNLRQIDAAINEWALENKKTNGTPVTENDITGYIKLNSKGKIPPCPSGGKYTYGKVGDVPQISCSLSTLTPPHIAP
jgi:hypothetical protein